MRTQGVVDGGAQLRVVADAVDQQQQVVPAGHQQAHERELRRQRVCGPTAQALSQTEPWECDDGTVACANQNVLKQEQG